MLHRTIHGLAIVFSALACAIAIALLVTGPAHAAAPWSEPTTLSGEHTFIRPLGLLETRDGHMVAAWDENDLVGGSAQGRSYLVTRFPGESVFRSRRALPRGVAGGLVTWGADDIAVPVLRESQRAPLAVAFGRARSGTGVPVRVAVARKRIARPALAGNARGLLALAWFDDTGMRDLPFVALRRPGAARFGRPLPLGRFALRNIAVGVGPRGDVVVAMETRGVVRVRVLRAGESGFGAVQTLRSRDTYFADLHVAVSSAGRAIVAWGAQFASEGGDRGPIYVEAATLPAGGRRFGPAQTLEAGPSTAEQPNVDLAFTSPRDAVVAWTGAGGVVRAAFTGPSGRFGAAIDLSAPERQLTDLAVSAGGDLLALWHREFFPEANRIEAAVAPAGATAFGPVEIASPDQGGALALGAFDASGRALTLFANRPSATGPPTVAQVAARG